MAPNDQQQTAEQVAEGVAAAPPVLDGTYNPDEWVQVAHKSDKSTVGLMPRAYFEGWGKDKGYSEVKSK